jgi:2-polyprenyl-6-methoxyphenol hydroxylase-like FAD-dependent oxidoreductase
MSPIGGVGVNLAVQDAVAAANILCGPLHEARLSEDDLARVQKRREFPARVTQAIQVFLQNKVVSRALATQGKFEAPLLVRLLARWPFLRQQGAETANVDKKMQRALKLARARALPTTGLDGA